jgi:uncharacterized FAD-dependent dehydrogenase
VKKIECGGVVLFETRVTDILLKTMRLKVSRIKGNTIVANKLILATGHSARDIFELLDRKKIFIEAKPLPWALELNIHNL